MTYNRGKLTKYKLMAKSSGLVSSLPKTRSLTNSNFKSLLKQYGKVIVKPSGGWGGAGVISILTKDHIVYTIRYGKRKISIHGIQQAYSFISNKRLILK
jgi:glutathione synthase/RimK-type ligase-like ATP-grasp enzyme